MSDLARDQCIGHADYHFAIFGWHERSAAPLLRHWNCVAGFVGLFFALGGRYACDFFFNWFLKWNAMPTTGISNKMLIDSA